MKNVFTKFHIFLSHHSFVYATIAGIGIVLFWRGVWHTADLVHAYASHSYAALSIDTVQYPWWDGPLSFVVGCVILFASKAFVSSFIGNELILSGLRTEKKLAQETESDLKGEVAAITEIKEEIGSIARKLEELEVQVKDHHK